MCCVPWHVNRASSGSAPDGTAVQYIEEVMPAVLAALHANGLLTADLSESNQMYMARNKTSSACLTKCLYVMFGDVISCD